ncbi:MAG: hypothetical protein V4463_05245 [Pseudomonadota bacterium]
MDPLYNTKIYEKQGGDEVVVASGGKITEEPGGAILGRAVLNTVAADIGTAGSVFVISPFAGTIVGLAAVNHVANATTKTVLTAKLGGVSVTAPAWEVAVTAAAGTPTSVVPTAANSVAVGDVIEIAFDGGSSSVEPTTFSITILRTS